MVKYIPKSNIKPLDLDEESLRDGLNHAKELEAENFGQIRVELGKTHDALHMVVQGFGGRWLLKVLSWQKQQLSD